MDKKKPGLFGLTKTNRDFTSKETWGKNQFNSSFPASLCCYLASKGEKANYLHIKEGVFVPGLIPISDVFGIKHDDPDIYFAFESQHTPFQKYVIGSLPRTDLVIQRESTGECLSGLEIKLTALPDETTFSNTQDKYGSEIVVRPDTIVYLACFIAANLADKLGSIVPDIDVTDWTDPKEVLKKIDLIVSFVSKLAGELEQKQAGFLIQPIWKTEGKSPILSDNCLDIFVWSDAGFCHFISQIADRNPMARSISRSTRSAVWLYKMLKEIKDRRSFNQREIIDTMSFNTKNDKAFSSAGNITSTFMKCDRLINPIIKKTEIKNIILGGGQELLSPERRFDAIIYSTPELFE